MIRPFSMAERVSMAGDYQSKFSGIGRLYGNKSLENFCSKHIAIAGIGGVGSWVVEALARSGFNKLTLIDLDDICETNINRQLHALLSTVGRQKIEVMAERIQEINPQCQVERVHDFLTASTLQQIFTRDFDFVVDAIDSLSNKVLLINHCVQNNIPLVTIGGAGGRRDPTAIMTDDLSCSFNDGLLRQVRKQLRRNHQFPQEGTFGIPAVFSRERPFFPQHDGTVCQNTKDQISYSLDCNTGYGTASFVTGSFGFAAASLVLSYYCQE